MNSPHQSLTLSRSDSSNRSPAAPPLRRDLIVVPRTDRQGKAWFLVEDPVRNTFHRLGLIEYEWLLALNGIRSIDEARQLVETNHPTSHFTAGQAAALLRFASEHHLLSNAPDQRGKAVDNHRVKWHWNQWVLFDRDFNWQWLKGISGLFSKAAFACTSMLVCLALVLLSADWGRFTYDAKQVFHPARIWMVALVWLFLKVVHELGHLSAAIRFGCRPGKVGFAWMILAPVAFVDLSDMHRLRSKSQRVLVSCAGVYFELIVAAFATLLWSTNDAGPLNHWLVSLTVAASLGTILFNLNPLLRLDGYYALAELLNRPQLASESHREVLLVVKRLFLGQTDSHASRDPLLLSYGIGNIVYRYALMFGLVAAAAQIYGHFAAMIILGFMAALFSLQVVRAVRGIIHVAQARPALYLRLVMMLTVIAAPVAVVAGLFQNRAERCYGIVEYAADAPVRAGCEGSLIRVLVADEQWVEAGQPLLELENLQMAASIQKAEQELAAAEMKLLRFRELKRPAEEAAERKTVAAISQRLQTLRQQHASLIVTAPCDGLVLMDHTEQQLGAWFREGDALLRVVDPQMKRVVAAIPPQAANAFACGSEVVLAPDHFSSEEVFGQIRQLASQASNDLPHPALSARAGGPLAVHESLEQRIAQTTIGYVSAEIALNDPLDELRPGQTVVIRSLGLR